MFVLRLQASAHQAHVTAGEGQRVVVILFCFSHAVSEHLGQKAGFVTAAFSELSDGPTTKGWEEGLAAVDGDAGLYFWESCKSMGVFLTAYTVFV